MAKKTYKVTVGDVTQFVSLSDKYDSIAGEVGLTAAADGDIKAGQFIPRQRDLIEGGVLFALSVGYENKKRGRILISVDKLANRDALIKKSFNGQTIKSVSIRTFSKLV